MATKVPITETGIYFITFSCFKWLPLFEKTNAYNLVYKWFDFLTSIGHAINAFVIMPDHLHMLLHYLPNGSSLNTLVGGGKRFMGYEIINNLERNANQKLLEKMANYVTTVERLKGKKHQIWNNTFDAKACWGEKFLLQKLNYIHNNPCRYKYQLAEEPSDYFHSSASFYEHGVVKGYPVKHYREFL